MVKAILIDSENKEIREVEVVKNGDSTLKSMYEHLKCGCVDVIRADQEADIWVDDEGLMKEGYTDEDGTRHNLSGFTAPGFTQTIMGNGLVMGHDDEGYSADSPISVQQVQSVITFVDFDRQDQKPEPSIIIMEWG